MKKIIVPLTIFAAVLTLVLVDAGPASAFWPFNGGEKDKPEVSEEISEKREEWREKFGERHEMMKEGRGERHTEMAEFLGMNVEDLEAAIESGKNPHEIAEEQGKDIADLHRAHMSEKGFTDEEIGAHDNWMNARKAWAERTGNDDKSGFGHMRGRGR